MLKVHRKRFIPNQFYWYVSNLPLNYVYIIAVTSHYHIQTTWLPCTPRACTSKANHPPQLTRIRSVHTYRSTLFSRVSSSSPYSKRVPVALPPPSRVKKRPAPFSPNQQPSTSTTRLGAVRRWRRRRRKDVSSWRRSFGDRNGRLAGADHARPDSRLDAAAAASRGGKSGRCPS